MAKGTLNADNVSVGKPQAAGGIFAAPTGTEPPKDAATPLAEAFVNLGYVSEDGLTNAIETDTEDIKEWGGATVLTVQTSRTETFTFTFIESLNEDVLKQVYSADNVKTGEVIHNGLPKGRWVYVFEILLTGNKKRRIVVPNAEITEVGETAYKAGEAIGYETTLSAFPDKDGNTAYEYTAEAAAGGSPEGDL